MKNKPVLKPLKNKTVKRAMFMISKKQPLRFYDRKNTETTCKQAKNTL